MEKTCDLCGNPIRHEVVVTIDGTETMRELCGSHSVACRTALDLFHVEYVARPA